MSSGLSLASLLELCQRLNTAGMGFDLGNLHNEDVMIVIDRPTGRWQIALYGDGRVEMEMLPGVPEGRPNAKSRRRLEPERIGLSGAEGPFLQLPEKWPVERLA